MTCGTIGGDGISHDREMVDHSHQLSAVNKRRK